MSQNILRKGLMVGGREMIFETGRLANRQVVLFWLLMEKLL
jgi:hypothetical protein